MKVFTYEEILQALSQIEVTLDNLSKDISEEERPVASAKLKVYRQNAISLKGLYNKFIEAKAHSKIG